MPSLPPAYPAAVVFAGELAFFAASLPCLSGRRRGAWRFWSPAYPAFSLISCPHPPAPLPGGKGETKSLFRRGLRPRHPCIRPFAALTVPAVQVPCGGLPCLPPAAPCLYLLFCPPIPPPPFPGVEGGALRLFYARGFAPCIPGAEPARHWGRGRTTHPAGGVPSESPTRRKTDRTAFLLAVPAAKERGDRGRGTSAFEMVLSPGAGWAGDQESPRRREKNFKNPVFPLVKKAKMVYNRV